MHRGTLAERARCARVTVVVRWVLCAVASLSFAGPLYAQNVLRYPDRTVEVLGLRTWTLDMVQDSLAKYSPADSLHTHGCAAALRYKVGFADAAAIGFRSEGHERTIIIVREPQDSARVQLRPAAFDTTGTRAEWQDLIMMAQTKRRAFHFAAASYSQHAASHPQTPSAAWLDADSTAVHAIWRMLAQHRTAADRDAAVISLLTDPNFRNRMAAAAILGNFAVDDMTWWALVEASREDDGVVKVVARDVLRGLALASPRSVDWTPVLPALRAFLDGTSPFTLGAVVQALVATDVPPHLAPALLGEHGDELIFEFLGSEEPELHRSARELLMRLSGVDHGRDVQQWRRWARSLHAGTP